MDTFLDLHQESILGTIATFDRLIFKGHLNSFYPDGAFERYLNCRDVLLKDAAPFVEQETARLKAHAIAMAEDAKRPYIYLSGSHVHSIGNSKEQLARSIAAKDGITEGLVCVFFDFRNLHFLHCGWKSGNPSS